MKIIIDLFSDPGFGVGMITGIISGLITGSVTGIITGLIITKHFKKKDLKEEAWSYVFERVNRIVKFNQKLKKAIEYDTIEKFEDALEFIGQSYKYRLKNEFTMISEKQKQVIDAQILIILQISAELSLYISKRKWKESKSDVYLFYQKEYDLEIEQHFNKIVEAQNQLLFYDKLLLDKPYFD